MKAKFLRINEKGSSIIEVLVAVGILSITLTGVVLIMVNAANFGSNSEARTEAINYAKEAMDAVKNIRDNNYCNFFDPNDKPVTSHYKVYRDPSNPNDAWQITTDNQDSGWAPVFDEQNTEQETENLATGMERRISLEQIPGLDVTKGRRVVVEIKWTTKGSPEQTYTAITDIYKGKY